MSGERYAQLAAVALRDVIEDEIAAALATVETAQGLDAGTYAAPVAVVAARVPSDNRSPLIAVYWEAGAMRLQREGTANVDCTVVVQLIGGPDLEALERLAAAYVTALVDLIRGDSSLGGRVSGALVTDWEAAVGAGDRSSTRLITAIGVSVFVHNP